MNLNPSHAEMLSRDPRARVFEGRDCPGLVSECGRYPGQRLSSAVHTETAVILYRCALCGHTLSIEESGRVRNSYPTPPPPTPPPGALVRALAEAWDATRERPTAEAPSPDAT